MLETLAVFTRLGLTSFGGPTAHLGYFRDEFVKQRKWLTDEEYADLVALCQFMPGPASSQVGMAIGLRRAGYLGMLAAWVGFTMPSVVLMVAFALGVSAFGDLAGAGWLTGLKAAAVAVVAHAVLGMASSIVTTKLRAGIALAVFVIVLLIPHPLIQVGAIALAMLAGVLLVGRGSRGAAAASDHQEASTGSSHPPASTRAQPQSASTHCQSSASAAASRPVGALALAAFAALFVVLPIIARATDSSAATLADGFYRAGALVFGGGHVVLPLLEQETVPTGLVDHTTFLAGYGAAQAVPGPLFTFASYLGASAHGTPWLLGALIATIAIFLPGALLVLGVMPFWEQLRARPAAAAALAGANAAVVGILAAALYDPVFTAGVTGPATMALAAIAFVALRAWKVPAWAVVILAAIIGALAL